MRKPPLLLPLPCPVAALNAAQAGKASHGINHASDPQHLLPKTILQCLLSIPARRQYVKPTRLVFELTRIEWSYSPTLMNNLIDG